MSENAPTETPTEPPTEPVAEETETFDDEGSFFNTKKPKDFRDGLSSGIGNIVKGTLSGAAVFVGAPIKG